MNGVFIQARYKEAKGRGKGKKQADPNGESRGKKTNERLLKDDDSRDPLSGDLDMGQPGKPRRPQDHDSDDEELPKARKEFNPFQGQNSQKVAPAFGEKYDIDEVRRERNMERQNRGKGVIDKVYSVIL